MALGIGVGEWAREMAPWCAVARRHGCTVGFGGGWKNWSCGYYDCVGYGSGARGATGSGGASGGGETTGDGFGDMEARW